jgi:hypothetical protein
MASRVRRSEILKDPQPPVVSSGRAVRSVHSLPGVSNADDSELGLSATCAMVSNRLTALTTDEITGRSAQFSSSQVCSIIVALAAVEVVAG